MAVRLIALQEAGQNLALYLPTDATERTDGCTVTRYRCCTERRSLPLSLILQERELCGPPRQCEGRETLLFLRPTFRPRRDHRRGFCLPSLCSASLDRRATLTAASSECCRIRSFLGIFVSSVRNDQFIAYFVQFRHI